MATYISLFLGQLWIAKRRMKIKYTAKYLSSVNMCMKKSRDNLNSIYFLMYQQRFNNEYKEFFFLRVIINVGGIISVVFTLTSNHISKRILSTLCQIIL